MLTTTVEQEDYFKYCLKKHPIGNIDSCQIFPGYNSTIDKRSDTFTMNDKVKVPARDFHLPLEG